MKSPLSKLTLTVLASAALSGFSISAHAHESYLPDHLHAVHHVSLAIAGVAIVIAAKVIYNRVRRSGK